MNMFWHELKMQRKSTLIWTFSIVGMTILFLSLFPSFAHDAEEFKRLLAGYPKGVMDAFGIEIDSITSFLGFYSYIYLYVMLCLSIQGMNAGIGALSKEVSGKTAEFLLTKPVKRTKILTSKLLAIITSFLFTNMVYLAASFLMAEAVTTIPYDLKRFMLISMSGFIVQLIFMALGILISVMLRKIKSVLSISLSTVFAFFILYLFGSVLGEGGSLHYTL